MPPLHVVTGALGYTGRAVAERLMAHGVRVRTLTNSTARPNPFGNALDIKPLAFDDADALARSLDGCEVLYNTYWVRFNHRLFNFENAVANTKALFAAAKRAGVARIVHVSILHARKANDLGYYKGKHELELALESLGVSHAMIRPGVLFGRFDVLVNNIAWVLRRLPIFGVFGDGSYALRPMHVDDMADLMVRAGAEREDQIIDAVGAERFSYRQLVGEISRIIGVRKPIVSVPPSAGYVVSKLVNPMVNDIIITREEISGLMRGLLDSDQPATGPTKLTEWAAAHKAELGVRYANEIGRRIERSKAYADIR